MITIDIPKALWLTSNSRPHRAVKWQTVAAVRALGKQAATASGERYTVASCLVAVGYPMSDKLRADPPNAYDPVTKAAIDGCVDAGLLPDDSSEHLPVVSFTRGPKSAPGTYRLTLTFTDQEVPF